MGSPQQSEALQELLRELASARGLRERIKIVERSLALVRSLSPHERERVAMRVGSQWAWKSIETFLRRDGDFDETDQLAKRAFERVANTDPSDIRKMVRDIRSGDASALGSRLADELGELGGRALGASGDGDPQEWLSAAKSAVSGDTDKLEQLAIDSVEELIEVGTNEEHVDADRAEERFADRRRTPTRRRRRD